MYPQQKRSKYYPILRILPLFGGILNTSHYVPQAFQYHEYYPVSLQIPLQDFCTWGILKNRPLLRKARGQIGAVDVSEFFSAVFVCACCASLRLVSPVMMEGTNWCECKFASGTLVSSMLGEPEIRVSHWHRPSQSTDLRGRGYCFSKHERGRQTYSRSSLHSCTSLHRHEIGYNGYYVVSVCAGLVCTIFPDCCTTQPDMPAGKSLPKLALKGFW